MVTLRFRLLCSALEACRQSCAVIAIERSRSPGCLVEAFGHLCLSVGAGFLAMHSMLAEMR